MNIQEFWESKELIAIHCDTQEKAKRLLKIFTKMGKTWAKDNLPYTQSGWSIWKNEMCYDNQRGFGRIAMYKIAKAKVIEFSELDEFKPIEIIGNEHMPSILTTRAWKTYNLIKSNSAKGKWTSKLEIVNNDKFDEQTNPCGYIYRDRKHDICAGIWTDIELINSTIGLKLIISNGKNEFKIPTNKGEALEYVEHLKNKAIKILARYSIYNQKIKSDGQGKLLSNQLNPIDAESKAKEFIETFIKEDK